MMWTTHIYPAVWADCNMFREYSNTPYLADFCWLANILILICILKKKKKKIVWLFFFTPLLLFVLLWKCFIHTMKSKQQKKKVVEKVCRGQEHCRPLCWHTLLFYPILMHINWAFSVHDGKHIERVLCYYRLDSVWDNKAYVCVFVSVFSALIKPWNRIEIGVLLELSSYLDCVWCDFCTWENSRLKCLPFVSNVIYRIKVNP